MKKYFLLALFTGLRLVGLGQNVIIPGDAHFKLERIKPTHDFYRNIVRDESGKIMYDFMMENYLLIDSVKKEFVFARYRQVPAGYFSTDTSFTDWHLKPLHMHEIHYKQKVDIQMGFQPKMATVTRNGITKTYAMPESYFEDNMIEYLFGYLELEKGVIYTLNNFNPPASGNDPYTIRRIDDEANTTILEFTHAETKGRIWIDQQSHEVLKQEGRNSKYHYVITKK
ncbi:hypothetical protein SNE25_26350 [Mucilaginibacter sabulilitoris]|uniref:DUF3108 domain-containing protein n=1 Tax=Mucilaginibacter sabulilitoris TaxID=1173583 RepID=A0ABZ0TI28_9SPHI|nr:hypothetical protein [Mucilaginibacter sabulilitoris]WPU92850.1 hypothetical protein SNE25_26350 [Mucilaginibacter sabulilitoris]